MHDLGRGLRRAPTKSHSTIDAWASDVDDLRKGLRATNKICIWPFRWTPDTDKIHTLVYDTLGLPTRTTSTEGARAFASHCAYGRPKRRISGEGCSRPAQIEIIPQFRAQPSCKMTFWWWTSPGCPSRLKRNAEDSTLVHCRCFEGLIEVDHIHLLHPP